MANDSSRGAIRLFKSDGSFFIWLAAAFLVFIGMLAFCSISISVPFRFALCLGMALLSFTICSLFDKYGFYVSFVLSFMQLLIHSYEFLVLQKDGAVNLAVITLLIIVINLIHKTYMTHILKKIYAKRKAESAERAKAINKQLEEDIFARTKLISSHDSERSNTRANATSDPVIDTLTTLPGRAMITDRLNRIIEQDLINMQNAPIPDKACSPLTVIYTSLDEISLSRLNIGHKSMDLFIQNMAHKLREAAESEDMVARIYGTEFVVLAKRTLSPEEFTKYKNHLSRAMAEAFKAGEEQMNVHFIFGVSVYPEDGTSADDLITRAEEAMTGKVTYGNVDMHRSVLQDMPSAEIISSFESAIASGDFHMVYQPCYTANGRVVGFEAFMRWTSEGKDIPPQDFIRAAVKCGYIKRIGGFSLQKALIALARLNIRYPELTMNINVSNEQLKETGFITEFSNALSNSGADINNVILDISEESLFTELPEIKTSIEKLSSLGVKMALDNFGRGYSSFNAIPLLPISMLKLDGNFTRDLLTDQNVRVLSSAAVSLMHDIDIKVCATGVGDTKQLGLLHNYGCDYFQGQVLGSPVEEGHMQELLD